MLFHSSRRNPLVRFVVLLWAIVGNHLALSDSYFTKFFFSNLLIKALFGCAPFGTLVWCLVISFGTVIYKIHIRNSTQTDSHLPPSVSVCPFSVYKGKGLFSCHFLPASGSLVWYCNLKNTLPEQQHHLAGSLGVCRGQNSVSSSVSKSRSGPMVLDILKYHTSTKKSRSVYPTTYQPQQYMIIKAIRRSLDNHHTSTSPSYYI